jgi:F420-dependent oxidoreductase-like protein
VRINLMIEGQEDVTWKEWVDVARACEDAGLEGLFRSDHYSSVAGRTDRGSLDAWTTLAGIASLTTRIRLGTLVSPVTFRHPSVIAKSAATVDHISGGRVELGLGAGWHSHEHETYGFPFPETRTRMETLAEQLEIVHRQWTTEEPFDFEARHYQLQNCEARPKPLQEPHPPIIIGGSGGARSAELAARWGDEYNTVFASAEQCRRRRERVARAWEEQGRDPEGLRFSLMTGVVAGSTEREVLDRATRIMELGGDSGDAQAWLAELRSEWVVGTAAEVIERLEELGEAGVERVMLQNQLHADVEVAAFLGEEVRPQLG